MKSIDLEDPGITLKNEPSFLNGMGPRPLPPSKSSPLTRGRLEEKVSQIWGPAVHDWFTMPWRDCCVRRDRSISNLFPSFAFRMENRILACLRSSGQLTVVQVRNFKIRGARYRPF